MRSLPPPSPTLVCPPGPRSSSALSSCSGETVLVNGATGTAGRLAVQLAKHLGAGKVIATGRNAEELEEVKKLGADIVIPFTLGTLAPIGSKGLRERSEAGLRLGDRRRHRLSVG